MATSDVSSGPKKSRFDLLEERMDDMFSCFMARMEAIQPAYSTPQRSSPGDEEEAIRSSPSDDWEAPPMDLVDDPGVQEVELDFRPETKEMDPLVPSPSPQMSAEGIECQRLGSVKWNRIRYKEAGQRLHAVPVFSALQVNPELGVLGAPTSHSWKNRTICWALSFTVCCCKVRL